jgi:tetratricopeptide (TPR) repeat protein
MQASAPASIEAQLAAAKTLYQGNDPTRAEDLLRTLSARAPAREDVATLLADVLRSQGRLSAASRVMLDVCDANAFEPLLCLRAAAFARQCDRHAIAAQICRNALARDAVPPELLVLAGHVARESGDFETARARYQAALDGGIDLDRHHVLGALANTKRYADPSDPEINRFASHFADAKHFRLSRASAGFALAKAQDDLADYIAAAGTLRAANAMARAVRPWDSLAWRRFVDARQHERVAAAVAPPHSSFKPVFVIGIPRTGTTLTASLLARATGARDRGELRALRYIAEQLITGGHSGSTAALTEAASLYRTLAVQDDEPATWYIDQDPLNFRWLHIAAAMFPQARVIHLRRDRRDTALSLWSQDFAHPDLAFAYDFGDTRAYMDGHDALMRHWGQSLSLPIFELDYETLVSEPGSALAKLRDFIGAPEIATEAPSEPSPVQSASVWQARQPIYSTSVGRWRHYAPHVPELASFG